MTSKHIQEARNALELMAVNTFAGLPPSQAKQDTMKALGLFKNIPEETYVSMLISAYAMILEHKDRYGRIAHDDMKIFNSIITALKRYGDYANLLDAAVADEYITLIEHEIEQKITVM